MSQGDGDNSMPQETACGHAGNAIVIGSGHRLPSSGSSACSYRNCTLDSCGKSSVSEHAASSRRA